VESNATRQIAQALGALDQAEADLLALIQVQHHQAATSDQLAVLISELSAKTAESERELTRALQSLQEAQMSFNLQYLQLQQKMQNDSRQFTAVSNIMKTKHDTVKNSISNIR
jgi:hypothetical protein